ncbi:hypothetical protein DFH07DRAFT_950035 [Mycena maculata]|uniref:CxC2-like cysteine cluster KDZ transposase-associated domain-containing protein n=1 Tax=Mycena maculata TaxID=230809 RepID=A0AAD7K8X4_9AGAR|nr:hypothetical protein DFH07DRAFT_950035 [Mycena maculata]
MPTTVLEFMRDFPERDRGPCTVSGEGQNDYICVVCPGAELLCKICIVSTHEQLPFHKIKQWNGSHFEACELRGLGIQVRLGHGGQVCPSPQSTASWDLISEHGIMRVDVVFCGCVGGPGVAAQLREMGWLRWNGNNVCATERVIEQMHQLQL